MTIPRFQSRRTTVTQTLPGREAVVSEGTWGCGGALAGRAGNRMLRRGTLSREVRTTPLERWAGVEVSGVIHCHTQYSDGTHSFAEVCQAADRAGLDYLLMTDHDNMEAVRDHGEKYWGRTLVLIGVEITPRFNHYLAYGVSDFPSRDLPPQDFIQAVSAGGGVGFCAHPHDGGSRVLRQKEFCWRDWDVTGYTGLEVWNYFSSWVFGCDSWWRALRGGIFADWQCVARDPEPRTLAEWDRLGQARRVVGIGGVDAHGMRVRLLGPLAVTFHPYFRSFRTVRTHLLLDEACSGDVDHDRGQILAALRAGRAFIANWERGDPRGFRFAATVAGGEVTMGAEAPHPGAPGAVRFSVALDGEAPAATIRLLWNGQVAAEVHGSTLVAADVGPGVYRVEVTRRGRGWIYSNPIYLRTPR